MCPWTIHRSRLPAMASPMALRTAGSLIQQSMTLTPARAARSSSSLVSSAPGLASHSPPKPTSLTMSPVLPKRR